MGKVERTFLFTFVQGKRVEGVLTKKYSKKSNSGNPCGIFLRGSESKDRGSEFGLQRFKKKLSSLDVGGT